MVSIIMPVYNVAEYIRECLESILNQTYNDIEIIAIDDGSSDESVKILEDYNEKFKKIKILFQKHKGVSEARNLALKHAKGKFILYVDSDDFLNENMIEEMVNKAEKSSSDIVMCGYYKYYENKENKLLEFNYNVDENKIFSSQEVIDMMLNYKIEGQLWNKLFRRENLIKYNFMFEPGRYIQDVFPVFKMVQSSEKIVFINKPLYYYRQRDTSTVKKKTKKLFEDYYHAMTSIIEYINENNIKVNNYSLNVFRTTVLSRFIAMYTNYMSKDVYKNFYNSEYRSLNVKFFDFLFLRNLDKREKVRVTLWKVKIFNFIKNTKATFKARFRR